MALEKILSPATELANRIYTDLGGMTTTEVHNITVNVQVKPDKRAIEDVVREILHKSDRG